MIYYHTNYYFSYFSYHKQTNIQFFCDQLKRISTHVTSFLVKKSCSTHAISQSHPRKLHRYSVARKKIPQNKFVLYHKQISNFLRSSKTNKYTRNIIFGGKMPLNSRNLPISPKKITPAQYCTQKDSPPS